MSPTALPAAIVRALRDPAPEPKDFTPTRFQPASNKAWFAVHLLRFISADFPRHHFTKRFYDQLIHCYGQVAHYADNVIMQSKYLLGCCDFPHHPSV